MLVSERDQKSWESKISLSRDTISRNLHRNLVKINQNLRKIDQNLGKSLSKGQHGKSRLRPPGEVFWYPCNGLKMEYPIIVFYWAKFISYQNVILILKKRSTFVVDSYSRCHPYFEKGLYLQKIGDQPSLFVAGLTCRKKVLEFQDFVQEVWVWPLVK